MSDVAKEAARFTTRSRNSPTDVALYVSEVISTMNHGELRVVIHDGCVVRIEKTEKVLCK